MKKLLMCAAVAAACTSTGANAALDLQVVASMNLTSAFGLAFDGTNIWYSTGNAQYGRIDQASMTVLGPSMSSGIWSEIAWDGSHIVFVSGREMTLKNPDGTTAGTKSLIGGPGPRYNLIDGFDIDGGKVYHSADVSAVNRYDYATGEFEANILPNDGGYSGVEKVTVGNSSFLMVVNDASSPRKLCKTSLAGAFSLTDDCATLPNSRYEGLAYDGRYLYAADYYGNRIDKIDLKIDGGSIFVPPPVPEPATYGLMLAGLAGIAAVTRRRRESDNT